MSDTLPYRTFVTKGFTFVYANNSIPPIIYALPDKFPMSNKAIFEQTEILTSLEVKFFLSCSLGIPLRAISVTPDLVSEHPKYIMNCLVATEDIFSFRDSIVYGITIRDQMGYGNYEKLGFRMVHHHIDRMIPNLYDNWFDTKYFVSATIHDFKISENGIKDIWDDIISEMILFCTKDFLNGYPAKLNVDIVALADIAIGPNILSVNVLVEPTGIGKWENCYMNPYRFEAIYTGTANAVDKLNTDVCEMMFHCLQGKTIDRLAGVIILYNENSAVKLSRIVPITHNNQTHIALYYDCKPIYLIFKETVFKPLKSIIKERKKPFNYVRFKEVPISDTIFAIEAKRHKDFKIFMGKDLSTIGFSPTEHPFRYTHEGKTYYKYSFGEYDLYQPTNPRK